MEIEHEELGIEDLFLQDKDEKIPIKITIKDKGDFKAYVTPISYGQIKKLERTADESEMVDYILKNHFFKSDKTKFTVEEMNLLPAGVLKGVSETIMELSGMNISNEDIKTF